MRHGANPATHWSHFSARHLYCRNCGAELRTVLLPLGYAIWIPILGLLAVAGAAVLAPRLLGPLGQYPGTVVTVSVLVCAGLGLAQAQWGTKVSSVAQGRHAV